MDPVDGVSRVIRTLRRRMAATAPRPSPASPERANERGRGDSAGPASHVRAAIAGRLKALDAADPRFHEIGSEIFVEDLLLAEFGAALTNDAGFRQIIRGVVRDMRADRDTAQRLDELIRTLRQE